MNTKLNWIFEVFQFGRLFQFKLNTAHLWYQIQLFLVRWHKWSIIIIHFGFYKSGGSRSCLKQCDLLLNEIRIHLQIMLLTTWFTFEWNLDTLTGHALNNVIYFRVKSVYTYNNRMHATKSIIIRSIELLPLNQASGFEKY